MREEELINNVLKIIDEMDINELGIKHQLEQEIARYDRFQYGVLGKKREPVSGKMNNDRDIRTYSKYILKE